MRHLSKTNKCPVCRSPSKNELLPLDARDIDHVETPPDRYRVKCSRCGIFQITGTFSAMLGPLRQADFTPDRIANFSSYIRENQKQLFSEEDMNFVLRIRTPSVAEKGDKLLRYIAKDYPYAGQQFVIESNAADGQLEAIENDEDDSYPEDRAMFEQCQRLLPYIAASWSRNAGEFLFLLHSHSKRFIEKGDRSPFLRVTPEGWSHLSSLETPDTESTTAFVAMWFSDDLEPLWRNAIRPAVFAAGYEPERIDAVQHANKIDDEIVARIRACKFLIADFTGQRGGVYFEAGFAMGLGKRVIWCVRSDDLENVHFDNRQFNFLRWDSNQVAAFKEALTARIRALFGQGRVKLAE